MGENKPIQLLYAYSLKWRDLKELSEVERASLVAIMFCENEVNALRRLSRLSMFWISENERINEASAIQRNTLLRALTGKLFEFLTLYNDISSKGRRSESIKSALTSLKQDHRDCKNHPGFKVAEKIRNSQAHHFDLDEIMLLSSKHDLESKCDFYFTPETGSTFTPFAEHLTFNLDPKGRLEEEFSEEEVAKLVDDWINWTSVSTDLLRKLREQLFDRLILANHGKLKYQLKVEYLHEDLKVDESFRLPIFIQVSR